MRVRVWIAGSEGPSHDFELLSPPRQGERISIAAGNQVQEGVVTTVAWQLQAIEPSSGDFTLQGDAAGSVTMVHVICSPRADVVRMAFAEDEADAGAA